MTLRTGHGNGKGQPRIEVLPPDELPAGIPDAQESQDVKPKKGKRRAFAAGDEARELGRVGGKANRGRRKLATGLAMGGTKAVKGFGEYRRAAKTFSRDQCTELAQTVGGGEIGIAPSSVVMSSAMQLAGSRFLFDKAAQSGDPDLFRLASQLANDSRQNLLAAHELAARQAVARQKARAANPHANLATALATVGDDEEP
jgi:hypothetical protein